MDEARRYVETEFQPSTLSKEDQLKEMEWFVNAAKPFQGMEINVVSETITTHEYEARTLAKAFTEITGIKVNHDLIQEGDVVEKIQTQMQSGKNIYDAWINDSDLIGTHFRYKQAIPLSDWMSGEGKDVTLPTLDVDDFIGKSFTTAPDGKLYQLPDQQFANLYWFRYDWFQRPDLKEKFKAKYGYELGVPVNWSAYEDIAEFFTNDVKEIDGVKVYGHMDYGKKDPSLGWRFTDAWLSMAGNGDKGIPNGLPVDEWGVRMEGCRPVGSSVERGGDTNGPASVYAIAKYVEWLKKYAPPQAAGMTFSESGPVPAQGNIAQQIFWYTAFTADMVKPGLPVVNADGTPKWRMAPSPHGSYWKEGMKLGYQDAGSWTLLTVDAGRSAQGSLALRPVHHRQVRQPQEEPRGPHLRPRERRVGQELHGARAQARRSDRVLPLAGAGAVDPDGQQHPRLSEARPALVAEHRRRLLRREDAATGHGCPCGGPGFSARAPGAVQRAGRMRAEAQQEGERAVLVRQVQEGRQHRPSAEARKRETEGRNGRLRYSDQELARVSAEAELSRRNDVARTSGGVIPSRPASGGRMRRYPRRSIHAPQQPRVSRELAGDVASSARSGQGADDRTSRRHNRSAERSAGSTILTAPHHPPDDRFVPAPGQNA